MAVDFYLEFDSDVEGETVDSVKSKVKGIDLDGFDWVATQSGTMHVGKGGGSGKVAVEDLVVNKFLDKASGPLLRAVCDGRHYKKVILTVRKAGKTPVDYLVLTMEQVIITSYSIGGNESDDRVRETIKLNFAKFKYQYTPQKEDGTGDTPVDFTWHIAENVLV